MFSQISTLDVDLP